MVKLRPNAKLPVLLHSSFSLFLFFWWGRRTSILLMDTGMYKSVIGHDTSVGKTGVHDPRNKQGQREKAPRALGLPSTFLLPQPFSRRLSLWICLFWTFHINVIRQYVVFCDGLLSLSIMFSRFIQVVECISTSFLLFLNDISFHGYTIFCLPFHK